jgi:hypothetical protein
MAQSTAILHRQLARVRRRLFLATLLTTLAWCWVTALGVAAVWFVVQPLLIADAPSWLRWAVAGGLVGIGTVTAGIVAVLRSPTREDAALAIDARFGLRERVVTGLTLRDDQAATPAGQALLADVEKHLAPLAVTQRFPVQVPWKPASLVPVALAVLVVLAFFWNPTLGSKANAGDPIASSPEAQDEIAKQVKMLARKREKTNQPNAKQVEEIQGDLDKFARKPHGNEDEVRDRIKEADEIEKKIAKRQKVEADRLDAVKEQMKQIERLKRKPGEAQKEGPARDLNKAMNDADFQKAKEEAERLSRQLDDEADAEQLRKKLEEGDKLRPEEKEQLEERLKKKQKPLTDDQKKQMQEQLADLKDQVERLSRDKEREKELQEAEKELKEKKDKGEIDQEQLDREMADLKEKENQLKEDQKDLEELAEKLGECQECMKEGKEGEAAEKLGEAAKKLAKMGKEGEQQDLAQQMAQLRQVRKVMTRRLSGGPGQAAGQRPLAKEGETKSVETRERVQLGKGKMEVVDTAPGKGVKVGPRNPDEMRADIREAAQQAPAAIDRQRLPSSAKKMARDYFEKLRGPDKDKKP